MTLTEAEKKILKSIIIPSRDNSNQPEFHPENPRWPSTPIRKINVPGFLQVYLKDESVNPTGTHKDRMAWEMVATYKDLLEAKKNGHISALPSMSIISSGSAANAIQQMFRRYHLPNLKVLLDKKINPAIKVALKKIGCEIYETDLSKKILSKQEILEFTQNPGGIDITSDDSLGPHDVFYDWLSYEVINQNPDYIFVPYGTGHLYENIINVAVREVKSGTHDFRFKAHVKKIQQCNFLGATSNNPKTIADKLYSPHLPFIHFDNNWIQLAIKKGFIGPKSSVYLIEESYFKEALVLAKQNEVDCEASGIAGLALLLQMKKDLPRDKKILIINTGKTKYL